MKKKFIAMMATGIILLIGVVALGKGIVESSNNEMVTYAPSNSVTYINTDGELAIVLQTQTENKTIVIKDYLESGLIRITPEDILYYQKTDGEIYMVNLKEEASIENPTKITNILDEASDDEIDVHLMDMTYALEKSSSFINCNDLFFISDIGVSDYVYNEDSLGSGIEFKKYDFTTGEVCIVDKDILLESINFDRKNNRICYITQSDETSQIKYIDGNLEPKIIDETDKEIFINYGEHLVALYEQISMFPIDFVYEKDNICCALNLDNLEIYKLGDDVLFEAIANNVEHTPYRSSTDPEFMTEAENDPFIIYLTKNYYLRSKVVTIPYTDVVDIDENHPDKELIRFLKEGSEKKIMYDLYIGQDKVIDNILSSYVDGLDMDNKFTCKLMNDDEEAKISMEQCVAEKEYMKNIINMFDVKFKRCLVIDRKDGKKVIIKDEIPELKISFNIQSVGNIIYVLSTNGKEVVSYEIDDNGKVSKKEIALKGNPYMEKMHSIQSDYREDFLITQNRMGDSRIIIDGKTLEFYTNAGVISVAGAQPENSAKVVVAASGDVYLSSSAAGNSMGRKPESYLYKYHDGDIVKIASDYNDYTVTGSGRVAVAIYDKSTKGNVIELYDEKLNKSIVKGDVERFIDITNNEKEELIKYMGLQ